MFNVCDTAFLAAAYSVAKSKPPLVLVFPKLLNQLAAGELLGLATEYAAVKNAVSQTLNNRGPMGMLAVSDSPYYDWLKTKNLDRGIL